MPFYPEICGDGDSICVEIRSLLFKTAALCVLVLGRVC